MIKKIRSFVDLDAWKEAHKFVLMIYNATKDFPSEEKFGLANQMRWAGVSITSNIAEGFSRQSRKEKFQFYSMAKGSVTEIQNQLLIARDVGYLEGEDFNKLTEQSVKVAKLINGLMRYCKK